MHVNMKRQINRKISR